MSTQTSPRLTRSISDVGESEQSDEVELLEQTIHGQDKISGTMESYYNGRSNKKRYMKQMRELWMDRRLLSTPGEKQLVTQHFNIVKRKLLL